ncbi:MAG: hypothetical protein QM204_04300 [Bacillota bacterium]|jgi:hypothetical protein|nr:hypothetical protein [Bacillota bacterium]NLL26448.1 hypothetical protein [Erysipelotrichia bacterium]
MEEVEFKTFYNTKKENIRRINRKGKQDRKSILPIRDRNKSSGLTNIKKEVKK